MIFPDFFHYIWYGAFISWLQFRPFHSWHSIHAPMKTGRATIWIIHLPWITIDDFHDASMSHFLWMGKFPSSAPRRLLNVPLNYFNHRYISQYWPNINDHIYCPILPNIYPMIPNVFFNIYPIYGQHYDLLTMYFYKNQSPFKVVPPQL